MEYTETMGIDISKATFDVYLHLGRKHRKFRNNLSGFEALINWANKLCELEKCLICLEHTGAYSVPISTFFTKRSQPFCIVSGLEIKRSIGLKRGKDDQIDALRIAEYAWLRRDQLKLTVIRSEKLFQLQKLLRLRARYTEHRKAFKNSQNENKAMFTKSELPDVFRMEEQSIHWLNKRIKKTEELIHKIIEGDQQLKKLFELMNSITGIGLVIATNMLVLTSGFTQFKDSRKFACYAGVAPFPHRSGTSILYKDRVSHYANKKIKALLNLAALNAVKYDPELKHYYERKQLEGKNRMTILNAVRNKLIHRIFAVVNRGTPYVQLKSYASTSMN